MIRAVLLLVLLATLSACGPARPPADYVQEPITDYAWTALGNQVAFGSSLHDRPDYRAEAVAAIESAEAAQPWPSYGGLSFVVVAYPVQLGGVESSYAGPVGDVESYTDLNTGQVFLSWVLAGPVGDPANDYFSIGNIPVEMANWRCRCESQLLPGGAPP